MIADISIQRLLDGWFKFPVLYTPGDNKALACIWLVVLLPVLCLLPFLDKAFNMDDPMFIWSAQQILKDPFDFYGFQVNWYGFHFDQADLINQNPPGVAYYLAAAGTLLGWRESSLHAAMLLPVAVVGWGCYRLAQRLCGLPLTATLISILTPVFLVSANTLMSDILMLAFYIWAVVWWIRGLESDRWWCLALAGFLVVLAALTKYFGLSLFILLGTYACFYKRRVGIWLFYLVAAFIPIMAFEFYVHHLYGHGLINSAFYYPANYRVFGFSQLSVGMIFLGGCCISLIFYTQYLWSFQATRVAGLALLVIMLLPFLASGDDKWEKGWFFLHWVMFLAAGLQILILTMLDIYQRRDVVAWLLAFWVVGVLVFAVFINWTVSGRSLLPMLPAVGILVARRLESRGIVPAANWRWIAPPVLAGVLAVTVLAQDTAWANSIRIISQQLMREYGHQPNGSTVWFQGAWGFQYYMQQNGAQKVQYDHFTVHAGDFIIIPVSGNNFSIPNQAEIQKIAEKRIPVSRYATTMSLKRKAAFYSSVFGSFPYFFGATEDTYLIYRAGQ